MVALSRPETPAVLAALALAWAIGAGPARAAEQEMINPCPRQVCAAEKVHEWTFGEGPGGWSATHDCRLDVRDGRLVITSTGGDPYLHCPVKASGTRFTLSLRAMCRTAGHGQVFWTTVKDARWDERKSKRFDLVHDGQWRDYEVVLETGLDLTALRLDPGGSPGQVQVERMELRRTRLHPLEIAGVAVEDGRINVWVKNHSDAAMAVGVGGQDGRDAQEVSVGAGQVASVACPWRPSRPIEAATVIVRTAGEPDLRRTVFLFRPDGAEGWPGVRSGKLAVRIAPDGAGAMIDLDGRTVAALAPLVHSDGRLPVLKPSIAAGTARLEGDGIRAGLAVGDDRIDVSLESQAPCEGPVLRVLGPLQQGLFAGLEYLDRGERSSSALDIETPERFRYAPDVLKVTMPLMAVVTDRCTAAVTWRDMAIQPVFASPNFFDGSGDHRIALRGRKVDSTILIRPPGKIEEAILWGVGRCGLPPPPQAPRSDRQQRELCLKAIEGPVAGEGGWGHCVEKNWPRLPYADVASTIWRLTGKAPDLPRLVGGGAHIRNDAIYFVTGRAGQWLANQRAHARGLMKEQKADGSFRYAGKYQRGHYEDTASGHCAPRALALLEFARLTGDAEALEAGVKALEYMKRFQSPRGAQTWELSLHTPDILASGYLVGACLRGHELTGKAEYLALARDWALSGVPFVYLWSRQPVMLYATVPVYGATNWQAPNWMGLPVQWCGLVYAYWLVPLSKADRTLDWRRLAEGILIAGEQMQAPDGPVVGCLPDSFQLAGQQRLGPFINPCALVSLRLALAGEPDSLDVACDGRRRVVSPFPATIRDGKAHIAARPGVNYQIVVDGARIIDVKSAGRDVIALE